MVCSGQGCTALALLLTRVLISSECVFQIQHDLDRSVEVHLLGVVDKRDLGEYQPGTVCELLHRLVELFLVELCELELRVAVGSLITLVDEEAVQVLGGPSLPPPTGIRIPPQWDDRQQA